VRELSAGGLTLLDSLHSVVLLKVVLHFHGQVALPQAKLHAL
jgi:hypothetical protein